MALSAVVALRPQCSVGVGVRMSEESRQHMSEAHTEEVPVKVPAEVAPSTYGAHQFDAVKQKLGTACNAAAQAGACNGSSMPTRRPRHYWTDATMRKELEPHVITVQHDPATAPTRYLPTRKALCQAGCTALATALGACGGLYSVAVMKLMNAKVVPRNQRQYRKPGARKGVLASQQTRQRMSRAHTGKRHPPEVRAKIAASRRGVQHSASTRDKIGLTCTIVAKFRAETIARQKAEDAVARAEAAVAKAEAARVKAAEEERRKAEAFNKRAEAARRKAAIAEQKRMAARTKAEVARVKAVAAREKAETVRMKAEGARVKAEAARVKAEQTAEAARARAEAVCEGKDVERMRRRRVGAAEMQQIVVELAQLKRDLKQWRSQTKSKYGRPLSEEETLAGFPHIHRKLKRHTELQNVMHSLD